MGVSSFYVLIGFLLSFSLYGEVGTHRLSALSAPRLRTKTEPRPTLFPCRLTGKNQTITFLPEDHSYPECNAENVRNQLEAKSAKYAYAKEGVISKSVTEPGSKVVRFVSNEGTFGLEEEFSLTFTSTLLANYFIRAAIDGHVSLSRVDSHGNVAYLANSTSFQTAWKATKRPYISASAEKIAIMLDRMISESDQEKKIKEEIATHKYMRENLKDSVDVLLPVLEQLIRMAETEEYRTLYQIPDLSLAKKFIRTPDTETGKKFMDEYTIRWRNQSILRNLARLYCYSAETLGKDLVVRLGLNHAEWIFKSLQTEAVNTGEGPPKMFVDSKLLTYQSFKNDPDIDPATKLKWIKFIKENNKQE